ncbi:MAG: hypothetical protein MJY89_07395 [Bacteroidales bacterium]|nr:hypothetical protein [Bacteroidales bacterium]
MTTQANAVDQFVSFNRTDATQLELTSKQDTIVYDRNEWEGVKIAVRNLRNDLQAVSGSSNAPIVVATVGKSALAKRWSKQCKQLKGKWEQYLNIDLNVHGVGGADTWGRRTLPEYTVPGTETYQYSFIIEVE